jgi:predicted nucleic acid-binding protein
VILADTGIWIDHFRKAEPELQRHLEKNSVAMHPFIVAELALGSLRDRIRTLATLDRIPQARVAQLGEVQRMIEAHSLYNSGIGLTDVHLLASTLITPFTLLWTRDKRLRGVAEGLGISANLS